VRDVGLGGFLGRLVPVVEFAFETELNCGTGGRTTGTISPGLFWLGESVQLGLEAILPVNDSSGRGARVMAQLHFYLDELFPRSLGRPIFGGECSGHSRPHDVATRANACARAAWRASAAAEAPGRS
jgi:hypothetical protein